MLAEEARLRQLASQNNDAGRAVKEIIPYQETGQARDHAAAKSERRLSTDGIIMPGSLVFLIPADLASGSYRLEVRVRFNGSDISAGRLKDVLTTTL